DSDAMLWQTAADMRFRVLGGYAVAMRDGKPTYAPGGFPPLEGILRSVRSAKRPRVPSVTERQTVLDQLRSLSVQTIMVQDTPPQQRVVRYLTLVLATPPQHQGGMVVWHNVDRQSSHQPNS